MAPGCFCNRCRLTSRARVVAVPDADQTPEMISGLAPGLPAEQQFARRLVENGCQVIVPVVINRQDTHSDDLVKLRSY